jgi:hypothetical protein
MRQAQLLYPRRGLLDEYQVSDLHETAKKSIVTTVEDVAV